MNIEKVRAFAKALAAALATAIAYASSVDRPVDIPHEETPAGIIEKQLDRPY
jgi:hypothetical protein